MKVQQIRLTASVPERMDGFLSRIEPQLVTVFGVTTFFSDRRFVDALRDRFPNARFLGCSTAGEISSVGVTEESCIVTGVEFDTTQVTEASTRLACMEDSFDAGARIGSQLARPDVKAIMVFAPGISINGSALVAGMVSRVGPKVPITGGLAGDCGAFARTWTLNSQGASTDEIVAIGLQGEAIEFAHGSFGGWKPFGPVRRITRCEGNVLYEINGEPALEVYKRYLGHQASDLPASGLLFPFAIFDPEGKEAGPIRTILGVDRSMGSLTLAGSVETGGYLKLMHADADGLVSGAKAAADAARRMHTTSGNSLAILVSCVGRKLVMGNRTDEEVEAVSRVFGSRATLTGFYSYGEISPFTPGAACQLHNQTMTISWLGEH